MLGSAHGYRFVRKDALAPRGLQGASLLRRRILIEA
jgi:hypothetical protein